MNIVKVLTTVNFFFFFSLYLEKHFKNNLSNLNNIYNVSIRRFLEASGAVTSNGHSGEVNSSTASSTSVTNGSDNSGSSQTQPNSAGEGSVSQQGSQEQNGGNATSTSSNNTQSGQEESEVTSENQVPNQSPSAQNGGEQPTSHSPAQTGSTTIPSSTVDITPAKGEAQTLPKIDEQVPGTDAIHPSTDNSPDEVPRDKDTLEDKRKEDASGDGNNMEGFEIPRDEENDPFIDDVDIGDAISKLVDSDTDMNLGKEENLFLGEDVINEYNNRSENEDDKLDPTNIQGGEEETSSDLVSNSTSIRKPTKISNPNLNSSSISSFSSHFSFSSLHSFFLLFFTIFLIFWI